MPSNPTPRGRKSRLAHQIGPASRATDDEELLTPAVAETRPARLAILRFTLVCQHRGGSVRSTRSLSAPKRLGSQQATDPRPIYLPEAHGFKLPTTIVPLSRHQPRHHKLRLFSPIPACRPRAQRSLVSNPRPLEQPIDHAPQTCLKWSRSTRIHCRSNLHLKHKDMTSRSHFNTFR